MAKQSRLFLWLYLGFLCLAYGSLGWLIKATRESLIFKVIELGSYWRWSITEDLAVQLVYGSLITLIFLINLALTMPSRLVKVLFGNWLQSDYKAFLSIFFWAFAVVLILCWLELFLRLLLLGAVTLLVKLELQNCSNKNGPIFNNGQILLILAFVSLASFGVGCWIFQAWGHWLSI